MSKSYHNSRPAQQPVIPEGPVGQQLSTLPLPTHDFVMLEQLQEIQTSIILPDSVQEKSSRFVVISKGPGRMTEHGVVIQAPCEVGDEVYVAITAGDCIPFKSDGRQFLLAKAHTILGIFPKTAAQCAAEIL